MVGAIGFGSYACLIQVTFNTGVIIMVTLTDEVKMDRFIQSKLYLINIYGVLAVLSVIGFETYACLIQVTFNAVAIIMGTLSDEVKMDRHIKFKLCLIDIYGVLAVLSALGLETYACLIQATFNPKYLKILWKMEHLLQKSKCSIFHNIFKSIQNFT